MFGESSEDRELKPGFGHPANGKRSTVKILNIGTYLSEQTV